MYEVTARSAGVVVLARVVGDRGLVMALAECRARCLSDVTVREVAGGSAASL